MNEKWSVSSSGIFRDAYDWNVFKITGNSTMKHNIERFRRNIRVVANPDTASGAEESTPSPLEPFPARFDLAFGCEEVTPPDQSYRHVPVLDVFNHIMSVSGKTWPMKRNGWCLD